MLTVYTVVVMRPIWFYQQVEGFDSLQDMTYIATVEAPNLVLVGKAARLQAFYADQKSIMDFIKQRGHNITDDDHNLQELCSEDYVVIAHSAYSELTPWLNEDRP